MTSIYDQEAHLPIQNSLEHLTVFCDNIFGAMNSVILDLGKLTGNISQLISSCADFSRLSISDQLDLYRKLSTYISMIDKSIDYLVLSLDVVQDVLSQYVGDIPIEYLDKFGSMDSNVQSYMGRVRVLIDIFRDMENGLFMRGIINGTLPILISEQLQLA